MGEDMAEAAAATLSPTLSRVGRPGRRLALAILTVVGAINFIDRQVLSVLIEPIRSELHLSDTAFGTLTGLSFALFYAAVGVPVAMLADRTNRVRLVAGACLVWSVFTASCGLATSFWQLALARFGVGVGEAGGTAPSVSILADYYPPQKRAVVIGLFTVNGPIGVFLGASLGGWAAGQFGWRGAFFGVGMLGAIAAPLLLLVVREPLRGGLDQRVDPAEPHAPPLPLSETVGVFLRNPALTWLVTASGAAAFTSYGMLNWLPAYLMRVQHMPLAAVAQWFGPAAGICFGVGIWGGGALVNVVGGRRAYALVPSATMALAGLSFAAALFALSWPTALALMCVPMAAVTAYVAPALALVQTLSPVGARTTATALLLLGFNVVGLGCGPLAVGALSDTFTRGGAPDGLKWALLALVPTALLAAAAYMAVGRALRTQPEPQA